MAYSIAFSEEKNELLRAERGVCFDDVVEAIRSRKFLDDKTHHDPKRSHQRLFIIKINNYAYVIPYVVDETKKEIFLKTIYPSRGYTKSYLKGGKNEK